MSATTSGRITPRTTQTTSNTTVGTTTTTTNTVPSNTQSDAPTTVTTPTEVPEYSLGQYRISTAVGGHGNKTMMAVAVMGTGNQIPTSSQRGF